MKYYQVTEGEWMRPVHRGHKLCCCDCGLVHTMDFRVVNGQVEYRAFRQNRSTANVRRHMSRMLTDKAQT